MNKKKKCSKNSQVLQSVSMVLHTQSPPCKTTRRMVHHRSMAFKYGAEQVKASTGTNQTLKHCNKASMVDLHVDLDQ